MNDELMLFLMFFGFGDVVFVDILLEWIWRDFWVEIYDCFDCDVKVLLFEGFC